MAACRAVICASLWPEAAWLAIDNNHSERQIKQLVMGRKAWLFAGSEHGAPNTAIRGALRVRARSATVRLRMEGMQEQ